MNGVGLCAVFSLQGDWAFDYALALARHHRTKLNIFHFLESPYVFLRGVVFIDAERDATARVTPELIAKKDLEMRETYDERLGDYVDVGFRLCNRSEAFELRKCFKKGDYEVLVIGYEAKGAIFGGAATIEEFAEKFQGAVVMVGPDAPGSYHLNAAAARQLDDLIIPKGQWQRIGK